MTDASSEPGQNQWKLIVYSDPDTTETIPITGNSLTIGRDLENDIPLDDLEVSRHHARITRRGEHLIIEDLNSANGTSVNGAQLTEPFALRSDDVIAIGSFTLKVEGPPQNIPQSRVKTSVHPTPPAKQKSRAWLPWLIAGGIFGVVVIILMGLFLGGWFITNRDSTVVETSGQETATPNVPTIVINQAPADNSQIKVNQSVTIQAIASDPSGVRRMELWVNGRKVDEIATSLTQNAPSMAGAFQWTPETPGTYALEIRTYNQQGLANTLSATTLIAVGNAPTTLPLPSNTPTPTITPLPPTFTPTPTPTDQPSPTPIPATSTPAIARLTVNTPALNVRSGPGVQYNPIGQLVQNDQVEIIGQANSGQGQWWQIAFTSAPGGAGWVSADPNLVSALNTEAIPIVAAPALPTATPTAPPTPTATTIVPAATVIRPPDGKTLLIISNRSTLNQPARLTLSGGKSVGGGKEFDPPPNGEIEVVLEPDFYRALWSSPARGGFARGADFTAVAGKVMVMWIVPEDGRTETEVYDQLTIGGGAPDATPSAAATPASPAVDYNAPPGRALLIAGNRSVVNDYAVVTISGGNFGGGQQTTLDANTETPLELLPGKYRAVWNTPSHGGFNAGREFSVSAGEVIISWIIPEDGEVFMQFPGQPVIQINN